MTWSQWGGTQQRLEALAARLTVGCLLSGQVEVKALQLGFRLLDRSSRHFPLYPGITYAATRRWARAHEAALAGFSRALWAATAWAADSASKSEAIEIISRQQAVEREAADRLYELDAEYRTRATPAVAEVATALDVVRRLRREMTAAGRDLAAHFDARYMRGLPHSGP